MKRNPWPYAIVAYFILFIAGIAVWVAFALRHDVQLVRKDYYEHEIKYQDQVDRLARTSAIRSEVRIHYFPANQRLVIGLPGAADSKRLRGNIQLYRPSDAKLDRHVPLALDKAGAQIVDVSALRTGLWKVYLSWTANDREYYIEEPFVVSAN